MNQLKLQLMNGVTMLLFSIHRNVMRYVLLHTLLCLAHNVQIMLYITLMLVYSFIVILLSSGILALCSFCASCSMLVLLALKRELGREGGGAELAASSKFEF